MAPETSVILRIDDIKDILFQINNLPQIEKVEKDSVDMSVSLSFGIDAEQSRISIFLRIKYSIEIEKDKNETILLFENETRFFAKNLESFITKQSNDELDIDEDLIAMLVGIAISTTRGIISEKTKGTYLQNLYLPILNPTQLLQQPTHTS